jgi:RNA polymerase sigma-70 factor (ECF subfamily)
VTPGTGIDEATIRAFVLEDYPRIVTGLAVMCGSRTAAEDAVQDAMARAWERSERGERIDSLPAWVTVVARNHLHSWFRRLRTERRAHAALEPAADPRTSTGSTEDQVDLLRAMAALTRPQRETTVLHYYLGMSVREVAEALGVSEGTVKSTLHRSRQILAPALGVDDPSEEVTHDARS